jgi:hypothetical protein
VRKISVSGSAAALFVFGREPYRLVAGAGEALEVDLAEIEGLHEVPGGTEATPEHKWRQNATLLVSSFIARFLVWLCLGAAKLCGCLVIVLPHFNRLKEWAYAGLVFDLVGATYSSLMVTGFDPGLLLMFVALCAVLASYWLWHKRRAAVHEPAR